ncbi:MAG: hypothetical protein WC466_03965 [Candidatus Izemoplasmatales bacterium]|jgi:hypothetical protein
MPKPNFLLEKPEPILRTRLYNGRPLNVLEGRAKISEIKGWADNPRIDLAKRRFQQAVGARILQQDELYDLMKNDPEVKLAGLRDDIMKNGLREPITLSFNGTLLDGNRRFFAVRFILDTLPLTDPNRQDYETINAYVLMDNATPEDEQRVLVEENFSPSLKIEWPDYVKASHVVRAHEAGVDVIDIAKKFKWPASKVRETVRINQIVNDFLVYATAPEDQNDELGGGLGLTEQEAETIAAKNYQFFNEAQKSFFDPLQTDLEFKANFFRWMKEEKFSSFPEVRIAYKAWKDPEAKSIIAGNDPTAAKDAKSTLDYNARIVRSGAEAAGRIDAFVKFLRDMKAGEIKSLPVQARDSLKEALILIEKMSKAASSD